MRLTLKDRLSLVDWKTLTLRVFIPLAAAILAVVILIVTADGGCRKHKTPGEDKTPLHYGTLVCGEKTLGGENAPIYIAKNGSLVAMLRKDAKTVTVGSDYTADAQKTIYTANGEIVGIKANDQTVAWVEADAQNRLFLYIWQSKPDGVKSACLAQNLGSDAIFMDKDSVYFTGYSNIEMFHSIFKYDLTTDRTEALMNLPVDSYEFIHCFDVTEDAVYAVGAYKDGSLRLWTMDRGTSMITNKTLDIDADFVPYMRAVPAANAYAFECYRKDDNENRIVVLKDGKAEILATYTMPRAMLLLDNIEVSGTRITWVVQSDAELVRDAFDVHFYDLNTKTEEIFDVGFKVMKLDGRLHYLAFDPYAGENWQNEVRLYAIE